MADYDTRETNSVRGMATRLQIVLNARLGNGPSCVASLLYGSGGFLQNQLHLRLADIQSRGDLRDGVAECP